MRPVLLRLVATAMVNAAFAVPASSHELGKSQVFLDFAGGGAVRVEIPVDPDVLLLRLDALAGRPLADPASTEELNRRLTAAASEFAARCELVFDGRAAETSVQYVAPPSTDAGDAGSETQPGLMRLDAAMPSGTSSVTWAYGLVYGSYPLVVRRGNGVTSTEWIVGAAQSEPIAPSSVAGRTRAEVALRYLQLGFTHILPKGLDHILFVLGIFLLSTKLRSVLWQVTSFTVAHSITLALTMYGVVSLPSSIVEPLIALSIAYVAVENLVTTELRRARVALVFGFGLLHGMGFAGVLGELGLPRSEFVTALVTFNVGVEAGQLAVIAAAFLLVALWCRHADWYRRRVVWPASSAIAVVGVYWTVTRLSG